MIPSSILNCTLVSYDHRLFDLRILDLSALSFTFRVSNSSAQHFVCSPESVALSVYQKSSGRYRKVKLKDYTLEPVPEDGSTYWSCYRIYTESAEFRAASKVFMQDYLSYLNARLSAGETQSAHLTPGLSHASYASELKDQYHKWFDGLLPDDYWTDRIHSVSEIAFSLNRPALWTAFLKYDIAELNTIFWASAELNHLPYNQISPTHLYIGNQFCCRLFPEGNILPALIRKAWSLHLHPVFVFSTVSEDLLPAIEAQLTILAHAAEGHLLELVVNDIGMLHLLQQPQYSCFQVTLGPLLFKRCKDSRLVQSDQDNDAFRFLSQYLFSSDFFLKQLCPERLSGKVSYESAGYLSSIHPCLAVLHIPFYQTNTSPVCEYSRNHRNAAQPDNAFCRQCENQVQLYPSDLNLVGIYNSLLGLDSESLCCGEYLKKQLADNISRIVFEFP